MAVSKLNPVAAASKTRYVETLTSGTSWTVPTGVQYVNAKLFGGGGGGGNAPSGAPYQAGDGSSGRVIETNVTTTPGNSIAYTIGAGGTGGGGTGGTTTFTGATSAVGGNGGGGGQAAPGAVGIAGEGASNYGIGGQDYASSGGAGGAGQIILEYWK